MNSPEESAVRDLLQFASNVLNGMLDMHSTAAELIRYSFSVRSIKDVVRRGSDDENLVNQIYDTIHHLVSYINEEIVDYSSRVTPVGMEQRHFIELLKRMQLMYEVRIAMNVNKHYLDEELTKHVEASQEAVKFMYDTCKDYPNWKTLSPELREFFLGEKKEVKAASDDGEPTKFAREDGVVSSLAHEKASDDEGKKQQFIAKTEKVLSNFRAKNPDYKTMRELINATSKFRLEGIYCDVIIKELISVWDVAIEHEAQTPDEKYIFTTLLKKLFTMMSEKRRNDLAEALFDKYKRDADDVLPCLENFVENFQNGLTGAIHQLPLDSNVVSNNMEAFETTKEQLLWYLLVSPVYTVQQLLTICVDNKGYIPLVIRVFRALPTLFDRSVSVTPVRFEEVTKDKLLVTILHRVFMIGRTSWTTASQWENAGSMTLSLAKTRKRKDENGEDKALLDAYSLVSFAFTELLKQNRKPQKAVEIFVKLLQRILANNNNSRMLTNFTFADSFRAEGENVLPTPMVISLMFELLVEYDGTSSEVCDGAREILKSIGGRLADDKIVFDMETCQYMAEENFNSAPWWVKYSIYTWFSSALRQPKRQVPSGIYKTMPEQYIDDFEQIKAEEKSTVSECYLRSLFELSLFDVDLAVELLQLGFTTKFGGPNLVEEMALALVDSYGKKLSKRNGGLQVAKLIKAMLKSFDPIRELVPLKSYSSSYFESIKNIEHILVLFMATRIAKEKQLSASRVRTEDVKHTAYDELLSLTEVSDQLMDVFCETTKAHVEKEASDLSKLRERANAIIFSPGNAQEQWEIMNEKDMMEQSFVLQLTMLYLNASHFCRLYQAVPIKLQQLMNVTLDKQFDSQKLMAKKVMDDVLTDQRKTEVVYAFAEPKTDPKTSEPEPVEPVKPSELFPVRKNQPGPSENLSAENAMFSINNQGYRHGRGGSYHGNRQGRPDHDRTSSSSRGCGNGRRDRHNSFRGGRWTPVNDMQTFHPKDRDFVHASTKYPMNRGYDRHSHREDGHRAETYDQNERLYVEDRRSPIESNDARNSERSRYSDSRDASNYDRREYTGQRYPSESEFSHEDYENRHTDQAVQSLRNFSHRSQQQQQQQYHSSRPGTSSTSSPSQNQEGKQQKKKFSGVSDSNRSHGNSRKPADRKPRYPSSTEYEQEEERKKRLKEGAPEREKLAEAMGFVERPPPPQFQHPRRGAFNWH